MTATADSQVVHMSTGVPEATLQASFEAALVALEPAATDKVVVLIKDNLALIGKVTTA